jgi:hypothetical protein
MAYQLSTSPYIARHLFCLSQNEQCPAGTTYPLPKLDSLYLKELVFLLIHEYNK